MNHVISDQSLTVSTDAPHDEEANYVTQNGITDTYVDIIYDTQTNNYASRKAFEDNDIVSESTTSLTSSVKNDRSTKSYDHPADLVDNTKYGSIAITNPTLQTAANVDDKIIPMYAKSKQTKQIGNSKANISPISPTFVPTTVSTPILVDACNTEHLTVTSNPVRVMAFTRDWWGEKNCNIHVTAPNNTAIAVRLFFWGFSDILAYFYTENVGILPQNCTDRYVLVSTDHTPCAAIIGGNQFRFHFENTNMHVEVYAVDIEISKCFDTQSLAMGQVRCELKSYAATPNILVDACITEHFTVTNTPILLTAFTRAMSGEEKNCSIHVTAPSNTTIAVRLFSWGFSDMSAYLYTENVGTLPQNCTDRYVLVSIDHTPCAAIIGGNQLRFYFEKIDMQVEVYAMNIEISKCFDTQSLAMGQVQCELKSYAAAPILVHACDTEHLSVTNTHVHVMAFTRAMSGEKNCNLYVTAPNNTAIVVQVINSDLNDISTYFYTENVGSLPQNCTDQYVLVSLDHTPCAVIIGGSQFRFHFQNSDMLVEVHAIDIKISKCFDTQSLAIGHVQCRLKAYTGQIQQEFDREYAWYYGYVNINRYLADCTCDCLCMCTLGYREWLSTCIDGKDRNTTRSALIVYKPNMEGLSFIKTGMSAIQAGVFDSLGDLLFLYLSDNNIAALPAGVFDSLGKLRDLDLSDNNIAVLPTGVFNSLGELRKLYLSDNNIAVLPTGVFDSLGELLYLSLSDNNIAALPAGVFDSLGELRRLDLNDNNIAVLPTGVFNSLGELRFLYLSDNNIAVIPTGMFDSLGDLSHLDLSDNNIAVLPTGVFNSTGKLGHLYLSDNNIAVIPTGVFDSLGELRFLYLSDNNISALPAGVFDSLVDLLFLNLSDTNIAVLQTGVFNSLGELRFLYLSDNNIAVLQTGVFNSLGELWHLDLSDNNIAALSAGVFESLGELRWLYLSDNNIAVIPAGVFDSLGELWHLDLSGNNISSLHEDVFTSLSKVHTLKISHNYVFFNLSGYTFKSLGSLQILAVSHNSMEILPDELFANQTKLLVLDLSSNALSTLPVACFFTLKELLFLDLCHNKLTIIAPQTFLSLTTLQVLDLSKNNIKQLPTHLLTSTNNLQSLDISENYLKVIPVQCFTNLSSLIYLNMSKNSLFQVPSFSTQGNLEVLDLSRNSFDNLMPVNFINLLKLTFLSLCKNNLVTLPAKMFYHMNSLITINVSYNAIQRIGPNIFSNESKLQTFDIRENTMYKVALNSFKTNPPNAAIIVDEYATCCFMDETQCVSMKPRPEYLTCKRMLQDVFLRISVWVLGLSAFICNGIAYYVRSGKKQGNKVQTLLISHLALSDLLMGVNMLILASADVYYGEFFPSYAHLWRQGFACKLAGFLSIFSSEGSVLFITLISIDRLLGIKYPFGELQLPTKWARFCVGLAWLVAFLISVIPIALASDTGDVFSISEVCIGIPIVRRHLTTLRNSTVEIHATFFKTTFVTEYKRVKGIVSVKDLTGVNITQQQQPHDITYSIADITGNQIATIFSIVVFVGVNLACFIIVAFCYMYIFFKAGETSEGSGRTLNRNKQVRMAKKMFAIVFTDFCCWVPLSFICILVQCGVITVSPEMYAWTVGFILPINSSINPFLYVLYETISNHLKKKREEKKARDNIEMRVRWKPIVQVGLEFLPK